MIRRETTADRINAVCNHPEVRPWVANGSDPVDLTAAVENPHNILLMGERGGIMLFHVAQGVYEAHTQVLPEGRGEWARELTEACVRWMFTRSDAYELTTRVPAGHVAAKASAMALGMRHEFTRPNGVVFRDTLVDCHVLSFRVQDWVSRTESLERTGEWIHKRMHEEADRLGIEDATHENDPNHNRYLGASVEMVFGGQAAKGVTLYNRWVSLSRQARDGVLQHVSIVSQNPVVIRFDIGLMKFHGADIEVIREC